MPDTVKIGIVIPVYNRRETTLQGLRSLSKIDTTGIELRIFIVDDGSPDGTGEAVRRAFPDVEVIMGDGTLHYAAGTNRGMEAALNWGADYVAAMNDDSVFHDQFLQRLLKTAQGNEGSVVGALLLLWDEPHKVFQVAQRWRTLYGGWQIPQRLTAFTVPREPFDVECLVGNCVIYPARALRECGLMDERSFPHGWGDAQYMMHLRAKGWRLMVDPKSLVWCEPNTNPKALRGQSIKDVFRIFFVNERHPLNFKRQFIARWYSSPGKPQAVAAFAVYVAGMLLKGTHIWDPWKNVEDPKQDWPTAVQNN
jgi:GT2 family glycosyltransferase